MGRIGWRRSGTPPGACFFSCVHSEAATMYTELGTPHRPPNSRPPPFYGWARRSQPTNAVKDEKSSRLKRVSNGGADASYCRSYSPLFTRFKTVNPAFLASEIDKFLGELKADQAFLTGFLQAGHCVKGLAESGRWRVNRPPHTLQSPSHNSYSYNGIRTSRPAQNPVSTHPKSSRWVE